MIDIWLIMCQLVPFCEVVLLTAIEYNGSGEQGANGEKTKTINHHGEMRVIKLDDESEGGNKEAVNQKPGSAWRPLEEGGGRLGCFTTWVLSLKSIRKYLITKWAYILSLVYHNWIFPSEMFLLPFLVALGVFFYCLVAVNFYFDSNYTTQI